MRGSRKIIIGLFAVAVLTATGFFMGDNYPTYAQAVTWIAGVLILGNVGVHWAQALKKGGNE